MVLEKLPIDDPKTPGGQHRMFGIAMTKAEEACAFKINEVIDALNSN